MTLTSSAWRIPPGKRGINPVLHQASTSVVGSNSPPLRQKALWGSMWGTAAMNFTGWALLDWCKLPCSEGKRLSVAQVCHCLTTTGAVAQAEVWLGWKADCLSAWRAHQQALQVSEALDHPKEYRQVFPLCVISTVWANAYWLEPIVCLLCPPHWRRRSLGLLLHTEVQRLFPVLPVSCSLHGPQRVKSLKLYAVLHSAGNYICMTFKMQEPLLLRWRCKCWIKNNPQVV